MIKETAKFYRTTKLDNLLVFQAHYQQFQFNRHSHEDFALGLMDKGVQQFYHRGVNVCAPKGSLITINSDEVHDGRSADRDDFCYRILYLPTELMQKIGSDMVASEQPHYFKAPVTVDIELADRLSSLFRLLDGKENELLQTQSFFYQLIADLLARHGTEKVESQNLRSVPNAVLKGRSFILDMARNDLSLDDIAEVAGLSRYHFLRIFKASLGISPYALMLQRRLQLAKDDIRRGHSLADAALRSGFADQSHLSRRFKATYGITPKQYQKAVC